MVVEAELSFLSNKSSHRLRPDTFQWQIWLKHESLPRLTMMARPYLASEICARFQLEKCVIYSFDLILKYTNPSMLFNVDDFLKHTHRRWHTPWPNDFTTVMSRKGDKSARKSQKQKKDSWSSGNSDATVKLVIGWLSLVAHWQIWFHELGKIVTMMRSF